MKEKQVLVVVGSPKKGEPPSLVKPMLQKGGDPEKPPVREEAEDGGPSEAGFWDQDDPHVCERCEHFEDDQCDKHEVDFEKSDPGMSGCSMWEGKEEEEEE